MDEELDAPSSVEEFENSEREDLSEEDNSQEKVKPKKSKKQKTTPEVVAKNVKPDVPEPEGWDRNKKPDIIKVDKKSEQNEEIRKMRQEENKIKELLIQDDYKPLISDCYSKMDSAVNATIHGFSYGCIIFGRGGLGKTHRITNMVARGMMRDEFEVISGYMTPATFFTLMYKYRDKKIVILDDVAKVFENQMTLSFLKCLTWHSGDGKSRFVEYDSTKPFKDEYGMLVPSKFEFNARVIIITNSNVKKGKKDNPHLEAVTTRIRPIKVNMTYQDVLTVMEQVIKNPCPFDNSKVKLSLDDRNEVYQFLLDNTNEKSESLNIRTLEQLYPLRLLSKGVETKVINLHDGGAYGKDSWKRDGMDILNRDNSLLIVEAILKDSRYNSEDDRIDAFEEATGKSRATYFRMKQQLDLQKKKNGKQESKEESEESKTVEPSSV